METKEQVKHTPTQYRFGFYRSSKHEGADLLTIRKHPGMNSMLGEEIMRIEQNEAAIRILSHEELLEACKAVLVPLQGKPMTRAETLALEPVVAAAIAKAEGR